MKIKLLFTAIFFAGALSAQTEPGVTEPDIMVVEAPATAPENVFEMFDIEKEPSFPGGMEALYAYLGQNIVYPDSAKIYGVRGTVVATFVINKDGHISDVRLLKDIGLDCGKEVFRVVSAMPAWIPGEAGGRKVKVRYTLPVRFKLD